MAHCCVPFCQSDSRKKEREISFHAFPKCPERRSEWITKIRRDPGRSFKIGKHTVVCSEHFLPSDFKRTLTNRKDLIKTAIPSVFEWSCTSSDSSDRDDRARKRARQVIENGSTDPPETLTEDIAVIVTAHTIDHDYCEVSVQLCVEEQLEAARQEIERLTKEIERMRCERFGLSRFMYDNSLIQFYTGFYSANVLIEFIELLRPLAVNMKTWSQVQRGRCKDVQSERVGTVLNQSLSFENQFFMCLHKYKLGSFDQDLAVRFNISVATVSRYIIAWTNFLYCVLGQLPLWPSKSQIKKTMPKCFEELYSSVRVIIDCTEMKVQTPSSLVLHSAFYSSYKSATTLKGLVGISPTGAVTFISSLYTGSISDKEITKKCGILDLLEEGDGVMADKGFTIEDILPRNCTLNIPPFLREEEQFEASDVELTQRIAKLRIHVERAIRRAKQYHIFDTIIPLSMASSINQIWAVCCMLTNFCGPLF